MKVGDRIIMLRADGWAQKGWTGIVRVVQSESSISVDWDNGKTYAHQSKDIAALGTESDPNIAFRMRKFSKKGLKL